jgi:predicted GH43/DUF377 family glycosyl hydrolase
MTAKVLNDSILLRPTDFNPLSPDFKIVGVFNPGVTRYQGDTILLVRVVERPRKYGNDRLLSPRAIWPGGRLEWTKDSFSSKGADTSDLRYFRLPDGRLRLRFISHLRLVRMNAECTRVKEINIIQDLLPREGWEEYGIEDPRITKIGDVYYITYVAISSKMGIATALMTTSDFLSFERHGIIFPTENKDVVLLPEKWQGNFVAYHRPVSNYTINPPSIETSLSPDAISWGHYQYLLGPGGGEWDSFKVGAGPPPLRVPEGWLLIYHGVSPANSDSPVGRYCVGAALLDGEDPLRIIARSSKPILCPERPYEKNGFASNVLFPTGALLSEDKNTLLLYSGAADEVVTMLQIPIKSVIENLEAISI